MTDGRSKAIALPAIVDLDALDQVRDRLLDAVEGGSVAVDAAGVERVCTNALLMLVSAAETARRNSFALTISAASEPMLAAIERLGLKPSFAGLMKG
jgi:anti-anti-sigma regulatory factor